jgi:electron transport complex protein RnfG
VYSLKHFIQQSWLLIVTSFFFGLLIAATDAALAPRIEMNKVSKFTNLAGDILGQGLRFVPLPEKLKVTGVDGRPQELTIYQAMAKDRPAGWVFRATGFGFADKIELVVAVDPNFQTIRGYDVLSSNETPNFGDQIKGSYFRDQFKGAPAEPLKLVTTGNAKQIDSTIVAISGATISSTAVVQAFNNYLPQVKEQLQQRGLIGNGSNP